ncbi:MAG TPA: type I methionyl aminopeptidase [Candidatus Saccharimonadia bacterium]|jgi:methionyl aminopeptidase
MMNRVKTAIEMERLRVSGGILAEVLRRLAAALEPGQTTGYLGEMAARELKALGGKPTFLGYQPDPSAPPYPSTICISVNDEVVHGIPGSRVISEGDLVGLDFGVNYEGMFTDGAVTVVAGGQSTPAQERLLRATREALDAGIAQVRAGGRVGDISHAIEARLRRDKLGIIEELSGHGVGNEVHEDPLILNVGRAGKGPRLEAGMSIAIEPMATLGSREIYVDRDGWTIRTADGSLGAQFEHTVIVTEGGAEVVTR